MNVTVAISMGDYNGIGPEVIMKSLHASLPGNSSAVILGHPAVFSYYRKNSYDIPITEISSFSEARPGRVCLIRCCADADIDIKPGKVSKKAGFAAMKAVEFGIDACLDGSADALVTAPISKEAIQLAGYDVPGHTEFLALKSGTQEFMMILASGTLRVGLVTGHIPIKNVPSELTKALILSKIRSMQTSLVQDFGISKPSIAVFGLNPHAGDGGVLGNEENDIIIPAILEAAKTSGIQIDGPLAADGFFGSRMQDRYDGIVAMYHDQGLVPFKALSFGSGVNFTAGLPFIRTSPDHGTAFGIAGKNKADPHSFSAAFTLAAKMAVNRQKVAADD